MSASSLPTDYWAIKARTYRRRKQRLAALGVTCLRVPIEDARARILELNEQGLGLRRISELSGIHYHTLQVARRGKAQWMTPENYQKLLDVAPVPAQGVLVPALVTHRMIHALQAIGWTCRDIDRERGIPRNETANLLYQDKVQLKTQEEIYRWYEKLSGHQPPATEDRNVKTERTKARRRAQRNGWAPPLAWDDILNPDELPQGVLTMSGYVLLLTNDKEQVNVVGGKEGLYRSEANAARAAEKIRAQSPNLGVTVMPVLTRGVEG